MRLYHFTAARFVPSIRRDGITRGFVLVSYEPLALLDDYRWLTVNGLWSQEWAEGTGRLPYRRDEVRITVNVPASHENRVHDWTVVGKLISLEWQMLNMFGDPENWRLYRGDIPKSWLSTIEYNPALQRKRVLK